METVDDVVVPAVKMPFEPQNLAPAGVGSHRLRVELGDTVVYAKTLAVHGGEQIVHIRAERSAQ